MGKNLKNNTHGCKTESLCSTETITTLWINWCTMMLYLWCWSSNPMEELTHRKRLWFWDRLKAGGEGGDRGWEGWMASPTRWTWIWANSRRWWRTWKPHVLQSLGLQRVGHDLMTEQQQIVTNYASIIREGNGTPFQYSCLETPMDGGAWWELQSMGSLRVGHDWATSFSLFTFMHWRRKWQRTPGFLPGESQGRGSLVGCSPWGCKEWDTT